VRRLRLIIFVVSCVPVHTSIVVCGEIRSIRSIEQAEAILTDILLTTYFPDLCIIMAALFPNLELPPLPPPPQQQDIDDFLDVVGFHNPDERLSLIEAGLSSCEDFGYLVDKDIRDMAEEFAK
jgi:hypothetical protein